MIEKMFDKAYLITDWGENWELDRVKVKDFIFETIIPEVIKGILVEKLWWHTDDLMSAYWSWYDNCIDNIKNKAKELYWIDL